MDLERSILDGSYFAAQQRDTEGDRRGADSGASSGGEYSDCAEGDCGDSDHDHDDGEAAGLPPAAMAAAAAGTRRPGPQTGVKGVIADARHAARQKADARRREKEARRAASAAPSAALSDDDDSGLDSDDCEIDRLLRGDLEDGILADDLLDEFKDILRLQREKEHERTISRLEGLGFGSLARLTKHNFVAHIEARVGPRVPTVVHFYSKSVPACRNINTALEALAISYATSARFCFISEQDFPEKKSAFHPVVLPSLAIYHGGQVSVVLTRLGDEIDCRTPSAAARGLEEYLVRQKVLDSVLFKVPVSEALDQVRARGGADTAAGDDGDSADEAEEESVGRRTLRHGFGLGMASDRRY